MDAQVSQETLTLLVFLFGDAAAATQRVAAPHVLSWCQCFDSWLQERARLYHKNAVKRARNAWRRLVEQSCKGPWELSQADLQAHLAWLQGQGYSASTLAHTVGYWSSFYRWCQQQGIQGAFDPAGALQRPQVERYSQVGLLSRQEVDRLLQTLANDPSPLGRRDHAFMLARLHLGVSLGALRELKWGNIQQDAAGAWLCWPGVQARQVLPPPVWQAIREALQAGGRLDGIQPGDFVFAPLVSPATAGTVPGRKWQAGDWAAGRCLSRSQLTRGLKLYGRLAGIEPSKLRLTSLRWTAVRFYMSAGPSPSDVHTFLGSQEALRYTKYRLDSLPQLPSGIDSASTGRGPLPPPERTAKPFQLGEGLTHGYYASSQPPQVIQAVLSEKVKGLDQEIICLRLLARGLLSWESQFTNHGDLMLLWAAYSQASLRLARMLKTGKVVEKSFDFDVFKKKVVDRYMEICTEIGTPLPEDSTEDSQESRRDEPELVAETHAATEEIAGVRYVLRNIFNLAAAVDVTGGVDQLRLYVRLVEFYGTGCMRLDNLLRLSILSEQDVHELMANIWRNKPDWVKLEGKMDQNTGLDE